MFFAVALSYIVTNVTPLMISLKHGEEKLREVTPFYDLVDWGYEGGKNGGPHNKKYN